VQLFRKIQTFRGESAFSSWLHRLTVNLVLMVETAFFLCKCIARRHED